ncbi:hypothetical protein D3C81_1904400 [compost metagenome]
MHRAAIEHRHRTHIRVVTVDFHLLEHIAQRVRRGLVDDHAHGAVVIVLADQRDAAREQGFSQRRQGDQQVIGERR